MASLIAKSPLLGLLPRTIGAVDMAEVEPSQMTLIAPFKGQKKAVSEQLKAALGLAFPASGRTTGRGARAVWCGKEQALLIGAPCPEMAQAACIDQSDAWAIVRLDGVDAAAVLARLTPIDLRASIFKRGHTARTLVGHMHASITRLGPASFEVMVMRSMGETLVHELSEAAENVAARTKA